MLFSSFEASSVVRNSPLSLLIFYFHFSLRHPWWFHGKDLFIGFRSNFGLVLGMDNSLIGWSAGGLRKASSLDLMLLHFLLPLHKVIFWNVNRLGKLYPFSMLRFHWIGLNVAWEWIMLLKNGSFSIWDFEVLKLGFFYYLMNIDEKFPFIKSFDIVYVLKLIEKSLGLFLEGGYVVVSYFYYIAF